MIIEYVGSTKIEGDRELVMLPFEAEAKLSGRIEQPHLHQRLLVGKTPALTDFTDPPHVARAPDHAHEVVEGLV